MTFRSKIHPLNFRSTQSSSSHHHHGNSGSSARSGAMSASASSSRMVRRANDEPHIGRYKLLKTIGKGNFAKVRVYF
jgi:MAP/microtubule affinity-regulating kinase